ncbi:hypothetical protein IV102_14860 [bacterium]|nr:hypothetical protein [bacterium]
MRCFSQLLLCFLFLAIPGQSQGWTTFVSLDFDFEVSLPAPIRVHQTEGQLILAAEVGGGHIYGLIRHPAAVLAGPLDLKSEECRQAVLHYLERDGVQVQRCQFDSFQGHPVLRVTLSGGDKTITEVTVLLADPYLYLIACVRSHTTSPFDSVQQARFFESFRLLGGPAGR